jgi:hypothetical protein
VGAGLLANRATAKAFLHAKIRQQAGSYKGKGWGSEFVGAGLPAIFSAKQVFLCATIRWQASSYSREMLAVCLCRSLPASESWPFTGIASGEPSPAGWLLQGDEKPKRMLRLGRVTPLKMPFFLTTPSSPVTLLTRESLTPNQPVMAA